MPPTLSESKIRPSFCFPFKIPDNPTATNMYVVLSFCSLTLLLWKLRESFISYLVLLSHMVGIPFVCATTLTGLDIRISSRFFCADMKPQMHLKYYSPSDTHGKILFHRYWVLKSECFFSIIHPAIHMAKFGILLMQVQEGKSMQK